MAYADGTTGAQRLGAVVGCVKMHLRNSSWHLRGGGSGVSASTRLFPGSGSLADGCFLWLSESWLLPSGLQK